MRQINRNPQAEPLGSSRGNQLLPKLSPRTHPPAAVTTRKFLPKSLVRICRKPPPDDPPNTPAPPNAEQSSEIHPRRRSPQQDNFVTLGGRVAACLQEKILAVSRPTYSQVEAFINLLINNHILCGVISEMMSEEMIVTLRHLIFRCVEECARVSRPCDRADTLGCIGQIRTDARLLQAAKMQMCTAESQCCRWSKRVLYSAPG